MGCTRKPAKTSVERQRKRKRDALRVFLDTDDSMNAYASVAKCSGARKKFDRFAVP